ncbi:MAG: hypothetical protein ACR2PT_06620 [Endozoicomonas sp.]
MRIDSFRASVSYFNNKFKTEDFDLSDGYTLMSLITGMLGDTLALIGAELIGNQFVDKIIDKKIVDPEGIGKSPEMNTIKEREERRAWLNNRIGELVEDIRLKNAEIKSSLLPFASTRGAGELPEITSLKRMQSEKGAVFEELKPLMKELEGMGGLTKEEQQLINKARAVLFIISEAKFGVERLIQRVAQDFSADSLDTGEKAIQERRISERLAQAQSASAATEKVNNQINAASQAKETLNPEQAVASEEAVEIAAEQAQSVTEASHSADSESDHSGKSSTAGVLLSAVSDSIPQVIPVEVAVAAAEPEVQEIAATSGLQLAAGTKDSKPVDQAALGKGQIQPTSGIPGLSTLDQNYLQAFLIPRDPTDITQLLAELEGKGEDDEGERLFYEAIAVAMRSDASKQAEKEQLNSEILAVSDTTKIDTPAAFAKQALDLMLEDSVRREQSHIAEDDKSAEVNFIASLKAAEFIAEIQDVPSDVADSREEEEELDRLVLKGSFV